MCVCDSAGVSSENVFYLGGPTLHLRSIIRNMQMHEFVDQRNGDNPWQSFCGSHILLFGIILTSPHMRLWEVSRMCMLLVLVSLCFVFPVVMEHTNLL